MRGLQVPSRTLSWNLLVFTFCFALRVRPSPRRFPRQVICLGMTWSPAPFWQLACPSATVCCPARDDITAWVSLRVCLQNQEEGVPRDEFSTWTCRGKLISHFKEAPGGCLAISGGSSPWSVWAVFSVFTLGERTRDGWAEEECLDECGRERQSFYVQSCRDWLQEMFFSLRRRRSSLRGPELTVCGSSPCLHVHSTSIPHGCWEAFTCSHPEAPQTSRGPSGEQGKPLKANPPCRDAADSHTVHLLIHFSGKVSGNWDVAQVASCFVWKGGR